MQIILNLLADNLDLAAKSAVQAYQDRETWNLGKSYVICIECRSRLWSVDIVDGFLVVHMDLADC